MTSEFYDQRETRSADQRQKELTTQILNQLKHAKANAPAYSKTFADVDIATFRSLDDLSSLPIIRKSELITLQQKNPPFGGYAAKTENEINYIFSSPGPIFEFQTSRPDYWRFARSLFAAGFRENDLVHSSFSFHMTPAGMMCSTGCHALGASVIPGGIGQTEQQLETVTHLKPNGYCGTPSFLKIMLEKADELSIDISSINKALVGGEAFPPSIREGFTLRGINALQCYATADLGLIAYESSTDSGLIVDEDIFIEIVTPGTGDRVSNGQVGEVVVTTLNPDYPFIRFATGDMSAIMEGESLCGRTNTRIKGWMGRADQTAKVKGMFIHPEQIAQIVKRHPEINRARLIIDWHNETDVMTLRCESTIYDNNLSDAISTTVQQICKVRGSVELVRSSELPNDGIVIEDIRKYD